MRDDSPAPLWLALALLAAFAVGAWQMLARAPALEPIAEIRMSPGDRPLILGRAELGQRRGERAADEDHLSLRHDGSGWWISNLSERRRLDAPTAELPTRLVPRFPLVPGARLRLQGSDIEVLDAGPGELWLRGPHGDARWSGGHLEQGRAPFADCPHEGDPWWLRLAGGTDERRLFSLGGEVPCPRRFALPGVPAQGAWVLWRADRWWLAPGRARAGLAAPGARDFMGFADLDERLDDPADPTLALILGRTRYRPVWAGEGLSLIPTGGADLWRIVPAGPPAERAGEAAPAPAAEARPRARDERVAQVWAPALAPGGAGFVADWIAQHWAWLAAALVLGLLGALVVLRRPVPLGGVPRARRLAAWLPTLVLGTLSLSAAWTGPWPPAWLLASIGLGWGLASLLLGRGGRLRGAAGWLWAAALGLALAGALVLGQIGSGGDNDRWLAVADAHWHALALIGWLLVPLTLVARDTLERLATGLLDPLAPRWWRIARAGLPALAVAVLLVQVAVGREEGLGGVQPVEGVKTLIALLLAFAGQRLWARRAGYGRRAREAPLRSSLELIGLALGLALLAAGLLWAVHDMSPALLLALLLLPVLWLMAPHPLGESPHARWVRAGVAALALAGIAVLVWARAAPQQVPDWLPQYARLMAWAQPERFPETGHQVRTALALAAAGGNLGAPGGPFAWLFLAHALIAWGNALGLLPVMGQPMTWLAAGNSHLLLFGLPTLVLGLAAGWLAREAPD